MKDNEELAYLDEEKWQKELWALKVMWDDGSETTFKNIRLPHHIYQEPDTISFRYKNSVTVITRDKIRARSIRPMESPE